VRRRPAPTVVAEKTAVGIKAWAAEEVDDLGARTDGHLGLATCENQSSSRWLSVPCSCYFLTAQHVGR
jgi:hypothetical protein